MSKLFGAYTIYSPNGEFELSANIDFKDNGYYMPNLTFTEIPDEQCPGQKLCWDNPDYLYCEFTKFLKRFLKKELKKKDKKNFKDIWHILNKDSCQAFLDMLKKSKELGWNKLKW